MIHVLPPLVAARIAAGEVVERPASVVKELVENALDAGASTVSVEIAGGGIERIRVVDDGCGIAADEVEVAFARHATSKLSSVDDLAHVRTLGFRGEALPSIAAVARVHLTTRTAGAPAATWVRLVGGRVVERGSAARAAGTTVTVDDLFADLPARRKFLRGPNAEAAQVAQVVAHLALARPDVRFLLQSGGRTLVATPGRGDLREVAAAVYDLATAELLREVEPPLPESEGPVRVAGLVGLPAAHRATRAGMALFVNGRWVQHRALVYAVEEAYHTLTPTGRHPVAILHLEVPTEEVDVNVHPTKAEVRFLRERQVFAAVQRAVQRTLMAHGAFRQFGGVAVPAEPHPAGDAVVSAVSRAPASEPVVATSPAGAEAEPGLWASPAGATPPRDDGGPPPRERLSELRVVGQVALTYIIAEGRAGLYLVDQHAAHERVLLERLRRELGRRADRQVLLEPVAVDLQARLGPLNPLHLARLEELGFQVEAFGPQTALVRAVPAALPPANLGALVGEALEALAESGEAEDWREQLCLLFSCKTAVKAGQALAPEEMRALIGQLEEAELCLTCSHGRPTAILLSHSQLEREFGRR